MFDELIANEIKRKEQKQQIEERPQLELPLPLPEPVEKQKTEIREEKRVIVIDLFSDTNNFTIEI